MLKIKYGIYKKIGLNWGEITTGECEYDKRVGEWSRMFNKGILIESKIQESQSKVSFPFLNNNYFIGQLYFLNIEAKPYEFKYKSGIYYHQLYTGGYKQINVANVDSVQDIKEVRERGVNFEYTFDKIFKQTDKLKIPSLKLFITKLINNGSIKINSIHSFIAIFVFPEIILDNMSTSTTQVDIQCQSYTQSRSKTPVTQNHKQNKYAKRRTATPNLKRNTMLMSTLPLTTPPINLSKTEISTSQRIDIRVADDSPIKQASDLKKAILKYESKYDKSIISKTDDVNDTIVLNHDSLEKGSIFEKANSRMRFKSFITTRDSEISPNSSPKKSHQRSRLKDSRDANSFPLQLFEKINSTDEEDNITVDSPLKSKLITYNKELEKKIINQDIKLLEREALSFLKELL